MEHGEATRKSQRRPLARSSSAPPQALSGTIRQIVRHPVRHLLIRWNWKSAVSSAIFRGLVFFAGTIAIGWSAAAEAVTIEVLVRLALAGLLGAATEDLRRAEPRWAATAVVTIFFPALGNSFSFLAHWFSGSPGIYWGTMASVAISAVAAAFNLFAMRRGVLLIGEGRQSFGRDLASLPLLIVKFLIFPWIACARALTPHRDNV